MDEQTQQQVMQLVQAAMNGDQQAKQAIDQIMQAAQQGDQQAIQLAQLIQGMLQQSQAQVAKFGAKLNYLKSLKGQCPEGYEYFKAGGCMKCKQKESIGKKFANPIEEFKCGRKMKKAKKAAEGTKAPEKTKVTLVEEVKGNTDGGYEVERIWSDGTRSYMQKEMSLKGKPITYVTGRRGESFNSIDNPVQTDSIMRDFRKAILPRINKNSKK